MERKVLSFDQFVFESYTTLNEEFNIKSLQNRLEGGELVNKGLSLVDELFSKSAGGIDDYSACMDAIEGSQINDKFEGDWRKIWKKFKIF